MICYLVKRKLGFLFRFVLRFLHRSFARAMGCFFGCFRIRDDRRLPTAQLVSESSRSKSAQEVVVSRNRLASLFLSEEKEDSESNDRVKVGFGSQLDEKGLKDEMEVTVIVIRHPVAKFLKACGTLAGTPAEIRKASAKLKVSPSCDKDSESSKFHSWLPNTSARKLQLDVQPFDPPTPVKLCEEWGKGTDSLEHTPSSCISNARDTQHDPFDSAEGSRSRILHTAVKTCDNQTENNVALVSPWPTATDIQRKNKSVRFECDTDLSSCGSSSEYGGGHMKKMESPNNQSAHKPSPYPTPMKLSDEMQTPGTVYPATLEDFPNGKPRVRSQFVYSFYKPGENVSQCKALKEEDFDSQEDSGDLQNVIPTVESGFKKSSDEDASEVEGLSSWLKPASVIEEERKKRMETAYGQISHFRKTPADRPIIGLVAAHWNEEDGSDIPPPKWWDGNGIPNSTNKYKEDQKVSWHATPFEERLEKALSEETVVTQRKNVCGKPIAFDDNEESDTALSQLQSSTHPQSVVSF
ncbi:protein JASON [Senna tora]|uniref:Protein JASON n=1 Tax=Senna tora TaxID=362788 RepID=A0A834WX04_9FABA|nr:protein JASON [Senna tora]